MYTMNFNMEVSIDMETQACDAETLQHIRQELAQSAQQIQQKYSLQASPSGGTETSVLNDFFAFAAREADELTREKRYSTARNYRTATARLNQFVKGSPLPFYSITPRFVSDFESYLKEHDCHLNTVSCYMRTLRAIYNKAVDKQLALQVYPFNNVFTGNEITRKRAIPRSLILRLLQLDCSADKGIQLAKDIFLFSFYMRGISFVDIAYLKRSHIKDGYLNYFRHKTHQELSVRLEEPINEIIRRYQKLSHSDYLFPILTSNRPEECHREYRQQLGLYNKRLIRLGIMLGSKQHLSSYVPRHTWATLAREQGIPMHIISESLGHTTERTTRIYVKSLEKQQLDDANKRLIYKLIPLHILRNK